MSRESTDKSGHFFEHAQCILFLTIAAFLWWGAEAFAQARNPIEGAHGRKQIQEFDGSATDRVDMQSRNLMVDIPLLSLPGRGMDLNLGLFYSSRNQWLLRHTLLTDVLWWDVHVDRRRLAGRTFFLDDEPLTQPPMGYNGWNLLPIPTLSLFEQEQDGLDPVSLPCPVRRFVLDSPDGTTHEFRIDGQAEPLDLGSCPPPSFWEEVTQFRTVDNSQMQLSLNRIGDEIDYGHPVVRTAEGTKIFFYWHAAFGPTNHIFYAERIEDRNGNQITFTFSPNVTNPDKLIVRDTVGRTVEYALQRMRTFDGASLFVGRYLDEQFVPVSITTKGVDGQTISQFTLSYDRFFFETIPSRLFRDGFGYETGRDGVGPLGFRVYYQSAGFIFTALTSVTSPNGQAFKISYDGGFGRVTEPSHPATGLLISDGYPRRIDYPTGGYVTYTWFDHQGIRNPSDRDIITAFYQYEEPNTYMRGGFKFQTRQVVKRTIHKDQFDVSGLTTTYLPFRLQSFTGTNVLNPLNELKEFTYYAFNRYQGRDGLLSLKQYTAPQGPSEERALLLNTEIEYQRERGGWIDFYNERPIRVCTTLDNGQRSRVEYTYDEDGMVIDDFYSPPDQRRVKHTLGNIVEARYYDYASPPCNQAETRPPLRRVTYSYLYQQDANYGKDQAHLLALLSGVTQYDTAGTKISERFYEYDQYADSRRDPRLTYQDIENINREVGDIRGNLTTRRDWVSGSNYLETQFSYDIAGNVIKARDPRARATTIEFSNWVNGQDRCVNGCAFPKSITNPKGHETRMAWDVSLGMRTQVTGPNNEVTQLEYETGVNSLRRLTRVIQPNGGQISYEYVDAVNSPSVITRRDLKIPGDGLIVSRVLLDGLNRPVLTISGADAQGIIGDIVKTDYDPIGRVLRVSTPYQGDYRTASPMAWTTYQNDTLDRTTQVTHPGGAIDRTTYEGPFIWFEDSVGETIRHNYDALGRIVATWEPDANREFSISTAYTYDPRGLLLSVDQGNQVGSDTSGTGRRYQYDGLGRKVSVRSPELGTVNIIYDDANDTIQATDARGITTTVWRDELGRVLRTAFSDQTPPVINTYDTASFGKGRLATSTHDGVTLSYQYTVTGGVAEEKTQVGACWGSVQNDYYLNGALKQVTYPSRRRLDYDYWSTGYLKEIKEGGLGYVSNMQYYPGGILFSMAYGNGRSFRQQINERQQATRLTVSEGVMDFEYSYFKNRTATQNNGNLYYVTDHAITPVKDYTYTYDPLGRIKTAEARRSGVPEPEMSLDHKYDRYGNLLGNGIFAIEVDPTTNRIAGYEYDGAGNLTSDALLRYVYDAANRLKELRNNSGDRITQYRYRPDGRRVGKKIGSMWTYYFYDLTGKVISEYEATESASGQVPGLSSTAELKYYHTDALGSPRVLTNAYGDILSRLNHAPFGSPLEERTPNQGNITFTGYYRDPEGPFYNAGFRYYVPDLGRFASVDPIEGNASDPQSLNRYAYARNNPLKITDPDGLCPRTNPMCTLYNSFITQERYLSGLTITRSEQLQWFHLNNRNYRIGLDGEREELKWFYATGGFEGDRKHLGGHWVWVPSDEGYPILGPLVAGNIYSWFNGTFGNRPITTRITKIALENFKHGVRHAAKELLEPVAPAVAGYNLGKMVGEGHAEPTHILEAGVGITLFVLGSGSFTTGLAIGGPFFFAGLAMTGPTYHAVPMPVSAGYDPRVPLPGSYYKPGQFTTINGFAVSH